MRILVVEDDEFTAKALETILINQNYAVELATDGQAAAELIDAFTYDLLILDVVLPGLDGISLCRRLRSQGHPLPILLLTGRNSSHDKAMGLDAGADDYVVKPCDPEELVARVRALLRRGEGIVTPVFTWEQLTLDPSICEVIYADRLLQLTPKEYALLELLMRNNRRVFSCGMVLEHLWSYEDTPGEEAVRTHIKGLRQKLKAAGAPADFIETVYGIGYRLKPLSPSNSRPQAPDKLRPSTVSTSVQTQTLAAIADLWQRFEPRLQEQINVIEAAITALRHDTLDTTSHQQAITEAHSLAGSLGTFGVTKGSQLAREIEQILATQQPLPIQTINHLQQQFQALHQAISQRPESDNPTTDRSLSVNDNHGRPQILLLDRDLQLVADLRAEANQWGCQLQAVPTLSAAQAVLKQQLPQVVLFNPATVADTQARQKFLAQLTQYTPPIPVLVLSAQKRLSNRLDTIRWGGQAFLEKPLAPNQILAAVNQVLHSGDRTEARVLIVDDDPQILATLTLLLAPWGLKVSTLTDPRQFWQQLELTMPDFLILDVKMPHIDGVELCRVVRHDPQWAGLPILFLTAHTGAEMINQVFTAGADDFVSKPIVGPELVNRLLNRLERTKLQQRLADTDPLTGVWNRHKSIRELEQRILEAERNHHVFCLAVLELDQLKRINAEYGYKVGDRVLCHVGQVLRQTCHPPDLVARWSGDEFVMGLTGIGREEGLSLLNQILETIAKDNLYIHEQQFLTLTVSAGIAVYPKDGITLPVLYHFADQAVAQAQSQGSGLVVSID